MRGQRPLLLPRTISSSRAIVREVGAPSPTAARDAAAAASTRAGGVARRLAVTATSHTSASIHAPAAFSRALLLSRAWGGQADSGGRQLHWRSVSPCSVGRNAGDAAAMPR